MNQSKPTDPIKALAIATIRQAVTDTQRGDLPAAYWLCWDGLTWLEACGLDIDPDRWQQWVERGCPRRLTKCPAN